MNAGQKATPLVRVHRQHRAVWILAVADVDDAIDVGRDFDAVAAACGASAGLTPLRLLDHGLSLLVIMLLIRSRESAGLSAELLIASHTAL